MSRPAIDTLAAQLSASLSEMSAALRRRLTEPPAADTLTESPGLDEVPRAALFRAAEAPIAESPFRKPSAPADKIAEPNVAGSGHGLLRALVATLRRLVGSTPDPPPASMRPTKRFRTARHRVRKRDIG